MRRCNLKIGNSAVFGIFLFTASLGTLLAQESPSRIRIGGGVLAGTLVSKTTPVYPPVALSARVQGTVILDALISRSGTVETVKAISGPALLRQSALDAVKTWRYKPYLLNGAPVEVESTISVNFVLTPQSPASQHPQQNAGMSSSTQGGVNEVNCHSFPWLQNATVEQLKACAALNLEASDSSSAETGIDKQQQAAATARNQDRLNEVNCHSFPWLQNASVEQLKACAALNLEVSDSGSADAGTDKEQQAAGAQPASPQSTGQAESTKSRTVAATNSAPIRQSDASSIDVDTMLQHASGEKLDLSKDEIERIAEAQKEPSDTLGSAEKWVRKEVKWCNSNDYVQFDSGYALNDAARFCGGLAETGLKALGTQDAQVELALQRTCALPRSSQLSSQWIDVNYCSELGDFYKNRGRLDLAMAVYQNASNCHANGYTPRFPAEYDAECPLGVASILKAKGEAASAEAMIRSVCGKIASGPRPADCIAYVPGPSFQTQLTSYSNTQSTSAESASDWQQNHQAKIDELTQEIAQHEEQAQQDDADAQQAEAQASQNSGISGGYGAIANAVNSTLNNGLAQHDRDAAQQERQQAQEERQQLAELGAEQPPVAVNNSEQIALTRMQTGMINNGQTISGALQQQQANMQAVQQAQTAARQVAQEVANGTVTPQQAMQQIEQQAQQAAQQTQPSATTPSTVNPAPASSTCPSFPAFVMASSNSIVPTTDMGQPGYQITLQYTIPSGYRLDNACAQVSNFGTSCNLQNGMITVEGPPGNQKIWTSVTLDNGTYQVGYEGTINDNLPSPVTMTAFQDHSAANPGGCGPLPAVSGAGTVN